MISHASLNQRIQLIVPHSVSGWILIRDRSFAINCLACLVDSMYSSSVRMRSTVRVRRAIKREAAISVILLL